MDMQYLLSQIDLGALLSGDYAQLAHATEHGLLELLGAWVERHTALSAEEIAAFDAGDLLGLADAIERALAPPLEQQRELRRWLKGQATTSGKIPLWFLCMQWADGNPALAYEIAEKTPKIWIERALVWRRGGPEGVYLSGGPAAGKRAAMGDSQREHMAASSQDVLSHIEEVNRQIAAEEAARHQEGAG